MKKLSLLLLTIGAINSFAQCIIVPSCTNDITVQCTDISNQSVNGSPCFTGTGNVPNSFNVNNALFWSFDGYISNYQNINLQYNQAIFNKSGHSAMMANTSISGHDTIWIFNGSSFTISNLIANNGGNTIMMGSNTHLYLGIGSTQQEYYIGDTIHTSGNSSNDVWVLSCSNIPLNIRIISFTINKDELNWEVVPGSNVRVEYSEDQKQWHPFPQIYIGSDHTQIFKSGFYRLRVDNEYSTIVRYAMQQDVFPKRLILYKTPNGLYNATKIVK